MAATPLKQTFDHVQHALSHIYGIYACPVAMFIYSKESSLKMISRLNKLIMI